MAQLKMYRPDAPVPDYPLPGDYRIRQLFPGEESLWCSACLDAFTKSEDPAEYRELMCRGVTISDVLVLEYTGSEALPKIAGTASNQLLEGRAFLHYVAVRNAHQGKGLSKCICAAVLRRHREWNRRGCFLTTDDPRLPAIKTYLGLGFLPVLWTEDASERWDRVLATLGRDHVTRLRPEECTE